MSDWLNDYLRDRVGDAIARHVPAVTGGPDIPEPKLTVHKMYGHVLMSDELAMDMGLIPDTRPPRKPPTRLERFRWWRAALRERLGIWAYERISGDRFRDPDDY